MTKILVVDDMEENRALVRYLFEGEYEVLEAADGAAALALVERERPDCILLDLHMPGMNGFEALARLEADPRLREIPVIVLTATGDSLESMDKVLRGGAVDYIAKPFSPAVVAIRVRGAIERHRLLAEIAELRASFTSMLVHDLRAPLTVIRGYLDLLTEGAEAPSLLQARYLGAMRDASDRMIRLIGDILDVSRLEAGRLTLTLAPVNLSALAGELVERLRPVADRRGVRLGLLAPERLERVDADAGRVEQVLMNLLGNALKFTGSGGHVDVILSDLEDAVEVAVDDTGPGIAPEELPLLFEKFRQTASGRGAAGPSSGLGLVICRHLVEAHGGRITVDSRPGEGSRFAFRIPRRRSPG
jgi:signal transduction histidine kinase